MAATTTSCAWLPITGPLLGSCQHVWGATTKLVATSTSTSTSTRPIPSLSLFTVEAKSRTRREDRTARHSRIRKKVDGTPDRPRLCVFRSNKHLYVQVVDDTKMHTLASASTMQKPISEEFDYSSGPTIEVAKRLGEVIAKSCLEKEITKVAFDRGGYLYHGRVKALADAAREHGLQF